MTNQQLYSLQRTDIILQVAAFLVPVGCSLVPRAPSIVETLYITVGAVQLVSCLLNWRILPRHLRAKSRLAYEWCLTILVIVSILVIGYTATGMDGDDILAFYFFLLFATPFLALWYFIMVCREHQLLKENLMREEDNEG